MSNYLDEDGLKIYDKNLKTYIEKIAGNSKSVSVDEENMILKVSSGDKTFGLEGLFELTKPATPTASLTESSYNGSQILRLTSTSGSSIWYTTDGSTPIEGDNSYSSGILLNQDSTKEYKTYSLKAIAILHGISSNVASLSYTIYRKLSSPSISISGDEYDTKRTISISSSENGTIKVSTDSGINYADYASWTIDSNVTANTIKAYATLSNWKNSDVVTNADDIIVGKKKMYYGIMTGIPSTLADIEALTAVKSQTLSSSKSAANTKYVFPMNGHRAVFAFPSSIASELSAIYDQNDFNQTSGFTKLTSIDGYIVYYKTDLAYNSDTYNFVK